MNIIKHFYDTYQLHKNPVCYWRNRGAVIGNGCDIHTDATLGTEPYLISIGNNVRINAGVQLITHDGGAWVLRHLDVSYKTVDLFKQIKIGNNVHIGTNAVIMPGVVIGDNCIIGVGAIVTKSVPDNSIAVGVPAKVIETIDEYINKNRDRFLQTSNLSPEEKQEIILKHLDKCK